MKTKSLIALYMILTASAFAAADCFVNIVPFTVRIAAKPKGRAKVLQYSTEIAEGYVRYSWALRDSTGLPIEAGNISSPITWAQQGDSVWILNNLTDSLGITVLNPQ